MIQYPHKLIATVVTGGSYNTNGDLLAGTDSTIEMDCRLSPRAGAGTVVNVDGKSLQYTYIVYLPLPITMLAIGTNVEVVTDKGSVKDTVKLMHEGLLNARIWL